MAGADGNAGATGAAGAATAGASGAGAGGVSGAGADDYRVAIEAERTTLCPGQCVELSAQAVNGHAPYRYAWADELGDGAGPHEVCPEETTTYSVTATDTGSEGEFGHKSEAVSASIELRVDEDCDEPNDAGLTEPEGTVELCSARIAYSQDEWISTYAGWEGNSNIATDKDGNLFVTGAFHGTFEVGEHTMTSVGGSDAFVIKYDPSCKPLWVKTFGAVDQGVGFGSIAVAPDGELAVGGVLTGTIDLGQGPLSSGFNGSAVVMKLDGDDGRPLWSQVYVSLFYNSAVWDIGIDDAGDIVLSGHAAADVSFGGPAIGGPDTQVAFIAKLSSDGGHRFSFAIVNTDLMSPFALHHSGVIALTGWGSSASVMINGQAIALSNGAWKRYVAMLDASGNLLWGHELVEPDALEDDDFSGYWGAGIAIDVDRNIVVEHGNYRESSDGSVLELPERITKLDAMGSPLWSKDFADDVNLQAYYGEGGVAVDSHRNILHTDESFDESTVTPAAQDAGVQPSNRLFVRKLTPEGDVIWRHVFDEATAHWTWGIAAGPDDAVWVAHGAEEVNGSSVSGALVISKLAP